MKNTNTISHSISDSNNELSTTSQIISWIDNNTALNQKGSIWQVGLACREQIMKIRAELMQDLECKHLRSWRFDNLRDAVDSISTLCKYPFIFKSPHHHYEENGLYIFAYKVPSPYKQLFYHVLHS